MKYKLSICIPTYNRAKYLKELLDSIIVQLNGNAAVEICISDNASTDNTAQLVAEYNKKYTHIAYFKASQNEGFDRNLLKVVSLAEGEYCWLMGDDDKIEPGAIEYILDILNKYDDLAGISVNMFSYDGFFDRRLPNKVAVNLQENTLLSTSEDIFSSLFYHFSFISAHIVKRSLWQEGVASKDIKNFFNACVHMYMLGYIVKNQPRWLYVNKECVGQRLIPCPAAGHYGAFAILLQSFEQVAKYFFYTSKTAYRRIMAMICDTHLKFSMRSLKMREDKDFIKKSWCLLGGRYFEYPEFWFKVLPWMLMPRVLLTILHYLRRKIF